MGEYIDIESHCKEAHNNLHKIMSILYRPIVKETKTRYSIEPYSPSDEVAKEFLDFPILPSMSALSFFSFREKTTSSFSQIFEKGQGEIEGKSLEGKWGWYNIIFGLANEDITKIKEVTELELYLVLTYMCYQQDKNNIQKNNYDNIQKRNR